MDEDFSSATSYVCEEILQKNTWLEIISNFVNLYVVRQKLPILLTENLIFPRYRQVDAVLSLKSRKVDDEFCYSLI